MKIVTSLSLAITGAALASLGVALPAQALTINFDNLPSDQLQTIPNGYQGFNWNGFSTIEPSVFIPGGSGYQNGVVSGSIVAYNQNGNFASFSSATPFTLNSAFLTGAWNDGLTVLVQGFEDTNSTASFAQSVVVGTSSPSFFTNNFTGLINRVTFTSSGGSPNSAFASKGFVGTQFALDNLTVNAPIDPTPDPDPDPAAIPVPPQLLGTVFGAGLGFLKARKRQKMQDVQQAA
jgi:hypothetical protein